MTKPLITPTIFVPDLASLKDRLELYEAMVRRVQLDVADEEFALQPSLEISQVLSQPTTLERDVHLMTVEPIEFLSLCEEEGVRSAIGQIENMSSQIEFIKTAKGLGLKAGLAIDLETEFKELDWPAVKEADMVLVMAVRAGKEGQKFNFEALTRVEKLRQKGYQGEICVDGGVNLGTIKSCVKAGADVLAVGSALWKSLDPAKELEKLYQEIGGRDEV